MNKKIYLLKFYDKEVNQIFWKKYSRIDAAKHGARDLRKNPLIHLIELNEYECAQNSYKLIEKYE